MKNSNKTILTSVILSVLASNAYGKNTDAQQSSVIFSKTQRYIVQFNDEYKNTKGAANRLLDLHIKAKRHYNFDKVISGTVVDLTKADKQRIEQLPFVKSVEVDTIVKPQLNWGQDRIDQRSLPLNDSYNVSHRGNGTNIYVIDTGIRATHSEFTGRIGQTHFVAGGSANDCHGHGTHVAGIAAGQRNGVAPLATINSVRISFDCTGPAHSSAQIAAMEWLASNAHPNSVINLSYEVSNTSVRYAIQNLVRQNHVFVTAAGNDNANACTESSNNGKPVAAIMVGSTTSSDKRRSDSNYGRCVDIFAPGDNISSAWHSGDNTFAAIGGTSMASPYVAGVAAGYRSTYPNHTQYQVAAALINSASTGKLSDIKSGSPNKLLFSNPTPTSNYWEPTSQVFTAPVNNGGALPPVTCTSGQQFLETIGTKRPAEYYVRVWKCK